MQSVRSFRFRVVVMAVLILVSIHLAAQNSELSSMRKNGRIVWKGFVFADFSTSAIYTSEPNGTDVQQLSTYPCVKIKTPRITKESRTVKRAEMTEQQKLSICARLPEPYSTLVLLLTRIPVRIEEAIGIKEADLDGHVLTIRRVVYKEWFTTCNRTSSEAFRSWTWNCLLGLGNWAKVRNGCFSLGIKHPSTHQTPVAVSSNLLRRNLGSSCVDGTISDTA